jgi:serine/threonine-protein kinase HipA
MLLEAADLISAGEPLPAELDAAVNAASSAGGARPKAVVTDPRPALAKFGMAQDPFAILMLVPDPKVLRRRYA